MSVLSGILFIMVGKKKGYFAHPTWLKIMIVNLYKKAKECLYLLFRYQHLVTKVLGPRHLINHSVIEIDITYRCNLGCFNCNRFLGQGQAPTNKEMTVEQIKKFTRESIKNDRKWERIRILGGEPTLHPNFEEILDTLIEYKQAFSPKTRIEVATNGYGEKVSDILLKVPKNVYIINTFKKSKVQHFRLVNLAPLDSLIYKYLDYSNGCKVISICGIGLTPYGYYPCAIAGSIDRIFGFDKGRKELPEYSDNLTEQLKTFCSLCGEFGCTPRFTKETNTISSTWQKAYAKHKTDKNRLSLY